jgi:hypothetical protein
MTLKSGAWAAFHFIAPVIILTSKDRAELAPIMQRSSMYGAKKRHARVVFRDFNSSQTRRVFSRFGRR